MSILSLVLIFYFLVAVAIGVAGFFAYLMFQKAKIATGVSIQCSSGDSEVMIFNTNFLKGETEESKQSKFFEAFQHIQNRRDENHAKWLAIKAKAIEENEKKDPADLKLRSVTEGA